MIATLRRRLHISETTWLFMVAALAGIAAGLGSIAFHHLIGIVTYLGYGQPNSAGRLEVVSLPWYPRLAILLVPTVGGLLVGLLIWRFAREAGGHGIPAVVKAVHERQGRIDPRVAFVKMISSALTLGSGGSLGREGPALQIGASLASAIGQLLALTPRQLRIVVAGGAAGGLAAIFNAPLGGAFFALEVIIGSFAMEAFGPVVVAAVAATVVSRAIMGDHPNIQVPKYALLHPWELVLYVGLGLATGAIAVVFTRGVAAGAAAFERVRVPDWLKPAFGGMACGLMAIFVTPRILGNGYETVDALLTDSHLEVDLVLLLAAKILATCVTLGSGGSGGVFGPSLFMGAVIGSAVGNLAKAVHLPVAAPGAYALVGMASFVAGATHAPVSMVLMLFEMTDDYQIVLPLLVATSIASLVAKKLYAESIDTVLDARKGIRIAKHLEGMALHAVTVHEAARPALDAAVPLTARLPEILEQSVKARTTVLAVIDTTGAYRGVIALEDLRHRPELDAASGAIVALDLLRTDVPVLSPEDPLTKAIEAFHDSPIDALPVVRENRFTGFLGEGDIVDAYRRAVLRTEIVSTVLTAEKPRRLELPKGVSTREIVAPTWAVGKTLAQLDLRRKHGVTVLAMKAPTGDGHLPDPQAPIAEGEVLVALGPEEALSKLEQGDRSA
ncbi:MAG TPA: chloride channel protein [Planctomycetota bacterium]|nr:chloride channel protein [Planctomycetota bacterium]